MHYYTKCTVTNIKINNKCLYVGHPFVIKKRKVDNTAIKDNSFFFGVFQYDDGLLCKSRNMLHLNHIT